MSDHAERLMALEEILAHQAKTIEELSDQVVRQWTLLDQARLKLDRLTERFLELEGQSREAAPVTRPPHY